MKNLPIGIQTFAKIRAGNYCYVDKTPLIAKLVAQGSYYFLARPRRFGKSLLVSTLDTAFSGQRELFSGLYLEHNWDWTVSHPVISLSMGRGVVHSADTLDKRVRAQLDEQAERHQIALSQQDNSNRLAELIRVAYRQSGQGVVVLVDEYDKPILDNLDDPQQAATLREELKNIYSVLKDSDAYLHFVLLTGVSKFSKVSIFSGLNNLEDITLDARFAALCGYTEPELKTVFDTYLENVDLANLRRWYNGYNFGGEPVYNPFDVLLYLRNRQFRNYWFETGTPTFLIKLMRTQKISAPRLENFQATERLLGSFDVDTLEAETLLFQTGYLTIQDMSTLPSGEPVYRLSYPNQEVRQALNDYFLADLVRSGATQERNKLDLYRILKAADLSALKELFSRFFASIPHDWYRKNQLAGYEGYYASIVYCYFVALGLDVSAEEATNHGQIDLTVRLDERVYLIEFKVTDGAVSGNPALAQIKARDYGQKYQGQQVYWLGVVFDKLARNIVAFDWEEQT
jgi:hypothetical protein